MFTFSNLHCQDSQVEGKSVLKQTKIIDNLRCANLSNLLPALRFVAFTITLLFCSLNTVFACKEIANYLTQNIYSHKDTTYRSPFRLPNFWRIKNIRSSPGTFRCTPFVKSSLQSHRPPMCPGIFSPFCKERNKNIWNALLLYLAIHLFILCVLKCAKRPAFLPGTFSIAWFARLLTLPSTWPFPRSGTPLRWGYP